MSGLNSGIVKPVIHGIRGKITSDVLDGGRLEHGPNGFIAHRTIHVEDIPGDGAAVLYNALLVRGVPYYGQSHPTIIGLPCSDRVVTLLPKCQHKARIDIVYQFPSGSGNIYVNDPDDMSPEAATIEVATTVQGAQTQRDYLGGDLEVPEYIYDEVVVDPVTGTSTTRPAVIPRRVVTVEYQLPMTIVRYRRRERPVVDGVPLFEKSKLYTGKINAATSAHPTTFGDPKHYWLIAGITGQSDDGGQSVNVTYEFQRNPDTWITLLTPKDTQGNVPPDLPEQYKVEKRLYEDIDFWPLNLTL